MDEVQARRGRAAPLLDPIIAGVGDVHVAAGIECNASRSFELAVAGASRAVLGKVFAGGAVLLHSTVGSISDVYVPPRTTGDALRFFEFTGSGAFCGEPSGSGPEQKALHGMFPGIGHIHYPCGTDGDILWFVNAF